MPRTILYTGKGGVGKTSAAAATALRCAGEGQCTLILSTDPAHSLSHSLERQIGNEPTELAKNLWGQEVQAQHEIERHWSAVRDWFGEFLMDHGINRITAEELTVPPGMDELFSLLELQRHYQGDQFDLIVVDCAPTGETLRLLAFPEIVRWWLDKILSRERDLLSVARPFVKSLLDVPLPDDAALADVHRLMENLVTMNELLRDHSQVSVRLVMSPDRMVINEAMSTFTYLNLYGYLTDAVIVNRIFPDATSDSYFAAWHRHQQEQLGLVEAAFSPVPILRAPYFEREIVGPQMLERLGDELFAWHTADEVLYSELPQTLTFDGEEAQLTIALPLADKEQLSLKKLGLELIVTAHAQKRIIILPPRLSNFQPKSANLDAGKLQITFHADDRPAEEQLQTQPPATARVAGSER